MFEWIRGRRGGGEEPRRRLMLALARAEQNLVEAHVRNALGLHDALGGDLSLEDALAAYLDALVPSRTEAEIVARRVLTRAQLHPGPTYGAWGEEPRRRGGRG